MSLLEPFRRTDLRLPALVGPGTTVLKAEGVSYSFFGFPVLRDIDLEVRSGEILALVGPNGAGKSTLLAALSGDIEPERGSITIGGAPLHEWSHRELAIRRGVLLQQVGVSFPFTVTEVVRMGRAPWAGTSAEEWDDDVVAQAVADADLVRFADRVYTSLSGGERARAALARVLAQEPGVLLLDEPTAALDIRHQELLFALARQRADRGDAVVIVLHDLDLAAAHSDRVAVLSSGGLVACGPPHEVFTAELLSTVYEHPVEVFHHPRTGTVMVVPERGRAGARTTRTPQSPVLEDLDDLDPQRWSEP